MESTFDVSDPSDWLQTALPKLGPVETALRCQICKDFYNTPMITSCSHTFCSLCIRRYLASDGRCPTCRASGQEVNLRRNGTLEELVEAFQLARTETLKLARDFVFSEKSGKRPTQPKRKRGDTDFETEDTSRSSSRRTTRSQTQRSQSAASEHIIVDDKDEEDQPDDGLVACPICNRRMKAESVFSHLDRCDGNPVDARSQSSTPIQQNSLQLPLQSPRKLERLPKLNYSLMKEGALRKKFAELGIPAWGPKPLLERRHTEWVNLWNANCDSSRPKSKREVLKELDLWERTQGGFAPNAGSASKISGTGGNAVMRKDFDGAGWAASHSTNFQQLISEARRKRSTPSAAASPAADSTPAAAVSADGGSAETKNESNPAKEEVNGALAQRNEVNDSDGESEYEDGDKYHAKNSNLENEHEGRSAIGESTRAEGSATIPSHTSSLSPSRFKLPQSSSWHMSERNFEQPDDPIEDR